MDSCDVVIVGGGPAGSTCAWALGKAGIDSLILDAQDFPRTKLCAGWITPAVLRNLDLDISSYPHSFLTFRKIRIEYFGKRSRRAWALQTTQFSIRRYEFDQWLLQRSGARFEKHRVKSIRREGPRYILDDRFSCRFLVGAGGTLCPVYRTFFEPACPRPRALQIATLEEEFSYPGRDDLCRLWFAEHGLAGYSWFVPKGNGWLNVGLGAFSEHLRNGGPSLHDHWRLFTKKLEELGLVRGHGFAPGGHTYFLRTPATVGERDNCYLVGDSAGLATRNLAEGIGPAVESGILAARAIATGRPYSFEGITRYSYLSSGKAARLAEAFLCRSGSLFLG